MAKKPRKDSKLKTLPDAVQAELYARYQKQGGDVLTWLQAEHGVRSSSGALSNFAAWYPFSRPLEMVAQRANQYEQALKQDPNLKLNAEQVSIASQMAFEQMALQMQDIEGFVSLRKMRLKEQEIRLADSALSLKVRQYEDKISAARANLEKAKSKGGLDKTTLQLIEEQLKLL